MESTTIRSFTNAIGRTTKIEEVTGSDGTKSIYTRCQYAPEHPMYKRLGVTSSSVHTFESGHRFYSLKGNVQGKKFEFESNIFNKELKPLEQVKAFVADLVKVRNYKPTKFLERIVSVAKFIK